MTRYLIERVWDPMDEEEWSAKGPLSKEILRANAQFSPVRWEHSHMVMDEDGQLISFCVYTSPSTELIHEHSKMLGAHAIMRIYEIGGDASPDDFD
jgi:hypothetical protein